MGKKLRPCPWCGTEPLYVKKYVYDNKWTQYRVGCEQDDCDAQPTVDWHYFTEQEAIDAWNNQAVAMENESLKAENAKLRELVTELAHTIVKCQNVKCDDCQFGNPTGFGCRWDAHMRELGVEDTDD